MHVTRLNRIFTAALAAMLAITNLDAQQPAPAFTFHVAILSGANLGGHIFEPGTAIDSVALNDVGEVAFVAHWIEVGEEKSAVLTSKRLVAESGSVLDGRTLTRVNANSLAINHVGQVAYEAVFGDSVTGVFVDRHFALTLNSAGTGNDFVLAEDGHVVPAAGVAAIGPNPAATQPAKPQNGTGNSLRFKIPSRWINVINNNSPIVIPPVISPSQPKPAVTPQASPAPQTSMHPQSTAPCPLPPFPFPAEWEIGAQVTGPITSHVFDGPANNRLYESPFFGKMATPFRTIQFSSDCRPLLIAIGDNSRRGQFELWTPSGLLTHTRADGFLELPGFAKNVLPGALVRSETSIRINRRGQIALPVVFDTDNYTILLATPSAGR